MKKIKYTIFLFLLCVFVTSKIAAKTIEVSSLKEFNIAQSNAAEKDVISWLPGTYRDIYLNITKNNITVRAKLLGKTIFTGASKAYISGNKVTFRGFQYINGNIGSNDVIKLAGNHINVSELNISGYTSYKYLVIKPESQYNQVFKCNFENRINKADKNILSVRVNENQPGFHKIRYCSFKNFNGTGGDMGVEPIRIGTSFEADFDSKTIVEYCYFTKCNGDGEIISNKSGKNILRYNTFVNNPLSELVLRHGSGSYVYGNFFLKGKGGVRVKEGGDHYIFNNYFSELKERSIILNSSKHDPIKDVYIMHNTFVKSSKLQLGGNKDLPPKKVILANNLFAYPNNVSSIGNATGKELWIGNMFEGKSGIAINKGLKKVDPLLSRNEFGFYMLEKNSPAVNSAEKSKIQLPIFKSLDEDNTLSYDILKQERPYESNLKDVGCSEFNPTVAEVLKPLATSQNTGPSYNTNLKKAAKRKKVVKAPVQKEAPKIKSVVSEKTKAKEVLKDKLVVKEKAKIVVPRKIKTEEVLKDKRVVQKKTKIAGEIKDSTIKRLEEKIKAKKNELKALEEELKKTKNSPY